MNIPVIDGLRGPIEAYDAVLCDVWGAVHDGQRPYPDALDCLYRIHNAGRRVILLSNAPRPSRQVRAHLLEIGVPGDAYDGIVTSGDATVAAVNRASEAAGAPRGYYHIGPARSRALLEEVKDRPAAFEQADYLLNSGPENDEQDTPDDYRPLLEKARARGLPMVCANPDRVVMRGDLTVYCAGALAELYERMGGEVIWHGKPHASVFEMALEMAGQPPRARVLVVGDGLNTDIRGARDAGLDAVWILGGIHREELGLAGGGAPDPERLAALCGAADVRPLAAVPALVW